jgi:glycosyltransferase involved in cell wall biosynthesis
MRILFVSPYLPHSAIGHGGGTVVFELVRCLARSHEICLLCFQREGEQGKERELLDAGVRVELIPYRSGQDRGYKRVLTIFDRVLRLAVSALSGRPYRSVRYSHPAMKRRLHELVSQWKPDAVEVEFFAMAPYAKELLHARQRQEGEGPLVALSTHEVETLVRLRRMMDASNWLSRRIASLRLGRIRRYECAASTWADRILCVSEQDRQFLLGLTGSDRIFTLPLGVPLSQLPQVSSSFDSPARILFVGSFAHPPNRQAARFLVKKLVPALRREHPALICEIVGRNPPVDLRAAADASKGAVMIHGFVPDLAPVFERSWLFVAPLFSGGGIKIKILEALGRGMPVLTTPIGLDGIDAPVGEAVGCAKEPMDFIQECSRLLSRPELLSTWGSRGREYIARNHDWPLLADKLCQILSGK